LVFAAYGYLKIRQESLEQAAEWFEQASTSEEQANVNTAAVVCNRGEILARMNHWQESVPVLRTCADMSKRAKQDDEATIFMNLATAHYMTRDFDQAEHVLLDEMEESPEVLQFLETVRSSRATLEEWARKKAAEAEVEAAPESTATE
jgi:predicted Zn-dependent protease